MNRLVVKHFGPIPNLDITLKPITIFVGGQGSGKSTISKLLTIFCDYRWRLQMTNDETEFTPFVQFGIIDYFNDDTYIRFEDEIEEIVITYLEGKFHYEGQCQLDEAREKWKNMLRSADAYIDDILEPQGTESVSLTDSKLKRANNRTMLYIPAERNTAGMLSQSLANLIVHEIPLSDCLLEYMSIYEKAKKNLNGYKIPFLNAQYVLENGVERISVTGKNGEKRLPLGSCSSGMQSALPLVMVLEYALRRKSLFSSCVIEEPEQNLFPESQRSLLNYILDIFNEYVWGTEMVITTHSPYILSCLNIALLAAKLDDKLVSSMGYSRIQSNNIAAYALDMDKNSYVTNLIHEKTGLISENAIDSVSEQISADFGMLYKLFVKSLKNGGNRK